MPRTRHGSVLFVWRQRRDENGAGYRIRTRPPAEAGMTRTRHGSVLCVWRQRRGKNGAGYRIRTRGPLITNQVLYQLS